MSASTVTCVMDPPSSASSVDSAAGVDSSLLASRRQSHVPLACFGNGRRIEPPRNNKQPRKLADEVFVPSQALADIMQKIPEASQARWGAALAQLGGSVLLVVLSVLLLAYSPWFFLPVAWIIAGASLSLMFIIGHDCAHNNWAPSPIINTLVGELSFLLLLQPFESFKLHHNFACEEAEEEDSASEPSSAESSPKKNKKKSAKKAAAAAAAAAAAKASVVAPPPTNDVGQSLTIERASAHNTEPLPWWMLQFFGFLSDNFQPKFVPEERKVRVYASIALSLLTDVAILLRLITLPSGDDVGVIASVCSVLRFWAMPLLAYRVLYSGICRLWTLNVRAFLPMDSPQTFAIASYNYALLTKALARSQYGAAIRNSSLVSLVKSWIPRINWINFFILTFTPLVAMVGMFITPLTRPTLIWSVIYYFVTGMGITAGYHRLWSHKAFEASLPTRVYLMLAGSGALQGSIKWWCGGHRIHHRYTDTPKDPYNAQGGFWYAHIGWMLIKPDPANYVKSDIRDLNADPLIRFQHKYYLFIGPFMAFVFPAIVAGLGWNDWLGGQSNNRTLSMQEQWGMQKTNGYFYAGAFRLFFVHHSTFCINSVAHYFGEHTFDDERSPRDNVITALLTFGEGYHNFHHEFPNDYRNGIMWYHYDPTKWMISSLWALGQTHNLRVFPKNEIKRGVLYMREKKLAEMRAAVVAPRSRVHLPSMDWDTYVAGAKVDGKAWIAIEGFVHDVTPFLSNHPGGEALLKAYAGREATEVFRGRTNPVIYKHSHAAENLLSNMRIAALNLDTVPATVQQESKKLL